jgi:hypothetical protein
MLKIDGGIVLDPQRALSHTPISSGWHSSQSCQSVLEGLGLATEKNVPVFASKCGHVGLMLRVSSLDECPIGCSMYSKHGVRAIHQSAWNLGPDI